MFLPLSAVAFVALVLVPAFLALMWALAFVVLELAAGFGPVPWAAASIESAAEFLQRSLVEVLARLALVMASVVLWLVQELVRDLDLVMVRVAVRQSVKKSAEMFVALSAVAFLVLVLVAALLLLTWALEFGTLALAAGSGRVPSAAASLALAQESLPKSLVVAFARPALVMGSVAVGSVQESARDLDLAMVKVTALALRWAVRLVQAFRNGRKTACT